MYTSYAYLEKERENNEKYSYIKTQIYIYIYKNIFINNFQDIIMSEKSQGLLNVLNLNINNRIQHQYPYHIQILVDYHRFLLHFQIAICLFDLKHIVSKEIYKAQNKAL